MEPLDIRIVRLIEALNQAGVDPAQAAVKQLVEGLLPPVTNGQAPHHDLKVGDVVNLPTSPLLPKQGG